MQFLKVNINDIEFVANAWTEESPINSILVICNGGEPSHFVSRTDWTIQILSRAESSVKSKMQIDLVYNLLKNRFRVKLPFVVVDKIDYPEVQTYQIVPIQAPGYLGADKINLEMWSYNLIVVTE